MFTYKEVKKPASRYIEKRAIYIESFCSIIYSPIVASCVVVFLDAAGSPARWPAGGSEELFDDARCEPTTAVAVAIEGLFSDPPPPS